MTQTEPKRGACAGRLLGALFALAALLGLSGMALAQVDQARVTGVVRDQANAVVVGATVAIKNERTGEVRTANVNSDGRFTVVNLRPSSYTVTVTAPNFAKIEFTSVELVVGQALNLDVEMKPAGATESITIVGGEEAALDTSSARLGANVNQQEVKGLPLNGRQLSQLYLQAPGALNSGSGTFGDIRFSGRAVEQNAVRYDGVEGSAIIDSSPGNLNGEIASPFRLQASLENVQEFRVESSSYPAEYGTGTGGQVSVVTKSGGNRFHGSAFEYLRNDKFDSRNWFDRDIKSPLRLNQFGASLGGPVVKDKFFFFGSYEGYRVRSGINIVEQAPKLSQCATAANPVIQNLCANAFLSPQGTRVVNTTPGAVFDFGQLVGSNTVNENSGALRLDYRANDKNSFYVRYFRDQGNNSQPQNVSGARANYTYVPQNAVASWQTTIGGNKINELKLGYNGVYTRVNGFTAPVNGIDLSASTINISGSVANSGIAGQGNPSGISIPGGLFRLNSATNGRGAPYTAYTIAPMDNFSWLLGNHSLKFGGEVRLVRLYTDRLGGTTYSYGNLGAFLQNNATQVQFIGDESAPSPFNNGVTGNRFAKQEYYIGYAQDEWRIKPNLTFNYGLRYEYYSPLREDQDRQVIFDIDKGVILPSNLDAFESRKTNFAPRLSVAWSPYQSGSGFIGGGKTVIRAGFGINYGPGQTEDQIQPIESDRVNSTFTSGPRINPAFPADISGIVANFNANPNNRSYQPRAYDRANFELPERIYSYTVSVQQELPYKMALTLAYVGSQGRNLFLRSVTNQITQVLTNVNPSVNAIVIREFSIVTPGGPGQNPTVQNPFAEVDYKTSGGHDSYNAGQVSLARRFNTGVTLNAQYTYGTSRGNTAGSNEALTSGNNARRIADFDYDDGYNNFDVRHTFNVSAIYALPFGKGLSGAGKTLLAGWELGTIMNVRSGLPIPVQITRPDILYLDTTTGIYYGGPGTNRVAVINKPGGGASRNISRPDLVAGVNPFLNKDRQILNPAAFAMPQPGKFGNLERNLLHGPSFFQQDLIVAKKFVLTEGTNLEFRSEFFNLFNATNFANPPAQLPNTFNNIANNTLLTLQPGQPFSTTTATAAFGLNNRTVERVVGLGTNRQIQFALRLNF